MKRSPNACANLPLEIKRARQYYTTAYSSKIAPLCASRPDRCYLGSAPAIARLGIECGDDFAVWWIADQVASYSTTLSEADRLTSADIDQLSLAIYANYSTLNLAEVMLFFSRLAAGIYGQVAFGRVRPENITAKIPLFMAARRREIERYEKERERMERAAANTPSAIKSINECLPRSPPSASGATRTKRGNISLHTPKNFKTSPTARWKTHEHKNIKTIKKRRQARNKHAKQESLARILSHSRRCHKTSSRSSTTL